MDSSRIALLRRRIGLGFAALGAASLLGAMVPMSSAHADAPTNGACNGAFQGNPGTTLHKTTSPADGSTVVAGQTVTVTITWDTDDWTGTTLDQIHDCVQVNGADIDGFNVEEKPTANDGSWSTSYTIPGDVVAGAVVCDRSSLSGNPSAQNPSTQKSNKVCFTVGNAPTTSTVAPTTTTLAPTTTTLAPTTTTVAPTTTTVPPTTTTTEGETTTTTVGETTTTVPDTTSTTVGETTSSTAPAATTTTVTVLGTVVVNDPTTTTGGVDVLGVQLARTGTNVRGLLLMAGFALLLGGLALIAGEKTEARARQ